MKSEISIAFNNNVRLNTENDILIEFIFNIKLGICHFSGRNVAMSKCVRTTNTHNM